MTTITQSSRRLWPFRRTVIVGVILVAVAALASTYVWLMTAHTIAPPSLRILDFLWTTLRW